MKNKTYGLFVDRNCTQPILRVHKTMCSLACQHLLITYPVFCASNRIRLQWKYVILHSEIKLWNYK